MNRNSNVLRSIFVFYFTVNIAFAQEADRQTPTVDAKLSDDVVWVGQPLTLSVTLYSPGPFDGTATFELPNLAKTVFVQFGRPVVSSQEIGGESYFSQTHRFHVFTRRTGEVTIPSFTVRFAGKPDFVSAAKPLRGATSSLTFFSKLPEGTDSETSIVSASEYEIQQTWDPDTEDPMQPGDVLVRRLMRDASGTTAMLFGDLQSEPIEGVRFYQDDPVLKDNTERGESSSHRVDTLKYQFSHGGTFQIPSIELQWWDYEKEKLHRETLPGREINVIATKPEPAIASNQGLVDSGFTAKIFIMVMAAGGGVLFYRRVRQWIDRRATPESIAASQVLEACRNHDEARAYTALLRWKRIVGDINIDLPELSHQQQVLAQRQFRDVPTEGSWSGQTLSSQFRKARRLIQMHKRTTSFSTSLPDLNPGEK